MRQRQKQQPPGEQFPRSQDHQFISKPLFNQKEPFSVFGGIINIFGDNPDEMKTNIIIEGERSPPGEKKCTNANLFKRFGHIPFQQLQKKLSHGELIQYKQLIKPDKKTITERLFFLKLMDVRTKAPEVWDRLHPIVVRVMERMTFNVEPRFRDLTEQHQKCIEVYLRDIHNGDFEEAFINCFGRKRGKETINRLLWKKEFLMFELNLSRHRKCLQKKSGAKKSHK